MKLNRITRKHLAAVCPVALALGMLAASAAPAAAQCVLNGVDGPCSLTGPLSISTYTGPGGTVTSSSGALTNTGTITLGGALKLVGDTTLTGAGVLDISGTGSSATGEIGTDGNDRTLTNQSTIQGTGVIGSNADVNQNLSLSNSGAIDANTNAGTLSIQGTGASITNSGTFEATGAAS